MSSLDLSPSVQLTICCLLVALSICCAAARSEAEKIVRALDGGRGRFPEKSESPAAFPAGKIPKKRLQSG